MSTGNFIAARSNYTGSDMGDSDNDIGSQQRRPQWGAQPPIGGGNAGLGGITEIGTIEVAGGRRSNRFAGGNSSNHSGSMNARQPSAGGRLYTGAANTGSGFGDVLDNEMSRPNLPRGRSTNLLSNNGS